MAKYTVEVSTFLTSGLGLLDSFKALSNEVKGKYAPSYLARPDTSLELIEKFGVEAFDRLFGSATKGALLEGSRSWAAYGDDFKKQFWYEFWSREIGQENPMDWQRLMYGRLKKELPMLMLKMDKMLIDNEAFITNTGTSSQNQTGSSASEGKNNSVSFGNNNNLSASATTPQDQINFALTVKEQYALGVESPAIGVGGTATTTTIGGDQAIAGYTFDYADNVSGGIANSNDSSAGSSITNGTTSGTSNEVTNSRGKDIFEIIEKMDTMVDGVFFNFFEDLKGSSLFIGLT